jgi:hypothetical protein
MLRHAFPSSTFRCRFALMALLLLVCSGCEVGHSWFNMSSDSPMPWFGFDLMPRRRSTSLVIPQADQNVREIPTAAKFSTQPVSDVRRPERNVSRELFLPSIPAFFDGNPEEELTFTGPTGAFAP